MQFKLKSGRWDVPDPSEVLHIRNKDVPMGYNFRA
jgi:hypothetical protein